MNIYMYMLNNPSSTYKSNLLKIYTVPLIPGSNTPRGFFLILWRVFQKKYIYIFQQCRGNKTLALPFWLSLNVSISLNISQNSVFVCRFMYSLYQSIPNKFNHLIKNKRPCYGIVVIHLPQAREAPPCQAVCQPLHTTVHCFRIYEYYSVKYIEEIDYKLW